MNWPALFLSLQVMAVASVSIIVVGIGLAWVLARYRFPGQALVETLITLPLVLPPTVLGYYILIAIGRGSPLYEWLNLRIVFTWQAAVLASTISGLPLMIQSARAAIANVDPVLENAARTLGSSEPGVFWRVTLPLARRGILAGAILGSARALGEFGATLMVAGNIPGRTQTLPLAVYDAVQNRQYDQANIMVLALTLISLVGLLWVRRLERAGQRTRPVERPL